MYPALSDPISRRTALAGAIGAIVAGATPSLAFAGGGASPFIGPADGTVAPFKVEFTETAVTDLRQRLAHVRLPDAQTVGGWEQGVPLDSARQLLDYWQNRYDFGRVQRSLNALPQYRTTIDGLGFYFIHVRSKHAGATPIVMTHGWPGSVLEFLEVIGPLTDPTAHGGRVEDAFHVVIPALPGYGFSDKPTAPGWGIQRVASAWDTLMKRLGYSRYVAQGGDWGSAVTTWLGGLRPTGLMGIHINLPIIVPPPPPGPGGYTPAEKAAVDRFAQYDKQGSGYAKQQGTRPQTLGYALADSPFGQAMWMYEKFHDWTDRTASGTPDLSMDQMLDGIMLYWLTDSAASSARLYWESVATDFNKLKLTLPVAASVFKSDIFIPTKSWAEKMYPNLVYWNDVDQGGHFAAWEQPTLFTNEVRKAFAAVRAARG